MLIATCVQSSDISESLGWSPYRHEWSWLMPSSCQHLSDKGAPIRACTTRLRGLGGNVHWEGCACWPATLPNHHHLQSCWQNNLDLEAVKGKIVAKVGVALLRPRQCDAQYFSSSLSEPITISHISFIDSTRVRFAQETSQRCIFNTTSAQLKRQTTKSPLNEVEILQAAWWCSA